MFINCDRAKGFTRGNVRICLLGTVTSAEKYLIEIWSNVDAEWKAVAIGIVPFLVEIYYRILSDSDGILQVTS